MAEHDTGYKALFSHPEMVADLIRGFVHEEWVRELDFSSLERFPASFVTPGLGRRESDILWRVRWGRDRWLYVYLLLEFEIPRMAELEEVKAMLAERVKEWTREWQQEGYEKGLKAGIEKEREEGRAALVRQLEKRFGPLPQKARQRIAAFDLEAILDLSASASTASSLEALGLSDS